MYNDYMNIHDDFCFTTYWVNFITMNESLSVQLSKNDLMRLLDCLEQIVLRFLNFTDIFLTTAQIWQVFLKFSLIAILLIDEFLLKPSCLMGADRGARKMNHFTTEVAWITTSNFHHCSKMVHFPSTSILLLALLS